MDIGRIPQQSFIPRQPAGQVFTPGGYSHVNPFAVGAVILFLVSLGLAGGVFAWVKVTQNKITDLAAQITQIKESFDQPTIDLLASAGNKIDIAKRLLKGHDAPSQTLSFLEKATLPTVAFTSMNYSFDGGSAKVALTGVAGSFTSLAAESDVFMAIPGIADPSFSNISLDSSGNVSFSLSFTLKPELLFYSSSVSGGETSSAAAVITTQP